MPYRKTEFADNEIYHIVVRRNGNNLLFIDDDDYFRGIFSIYEFNDARPVEIRFRRQARLARKRKAIIGGRASVDFFPDGREKLVEVLAFVLMPNHIHLLLRQLKDDGITKFISKFGSGYPLYFKEKHQLKEKGYFFQSRFVSVHIKTDAQLIAAFVYIHTNPLALVEPKWKEGIVVDPEKAIEFLENYKWSSYQDYLGKKNFPSVTERNFLSEMIGGEKEIKELINDWVRHKKEIKGITEVSLE